MNRRQADLVAGTLVGAILLIGILSTIQLYTAGDATMGHMDSVPAIHFVGPLFLSLIVASIVGGVYVSIRNSVLETDGDPPTDSRQPETKGNEIPPIDTEDATRESLERKPERKILDVLPEDERKILEPVIESPGLTQIEVRDRSDYSRSKVSQTITGLEKRGLLYREPQGRTYRVYPADDLEDQLN